MQLLEIPFLHKVNSTYVNSLKKLNLKYELRKIN